MYSSSMPYLSSSSTYDMTPASSSEYPTYLTSCWSLPSSMKGGEMARIKNRPPFSTSSRPCSCFFVGGCRCNHSSLLWSSGPHLGVTLDSSLTNAMNPHSLFLLLLRGGYHHPTTLF